MDKPKVIQYPCPADRSMQPAQVQFAESGDPRPLVVALHTWSFGYDSSCENYAELCRKYDLHLIYPHFRGPNWTSDALGSDLAVADIASAVNFMRETVAVDPERVYLIGGSGGGHMSLLMAGRCPEYWTAVSAWCPISDVAAWHRQCAGTRFKNYAEHIEKACGDPPDEEEMRYRSPLTWLEHAKGLPIDIATGIHDGHAGSVPISQAMNAFNALAAPGARFTAEEIDYAVRNEAAPPHLGVPEPDPAYDPVKIHIRRQSGSARLTIFEGAHDLIPEIGIAWLLKQRRNAPAEWNVGPVEAKIKNLTH